VRKLALAAAVGAALVAVPTATAKIVVQKSIAGVALGVTENEVIARLGQPKKISVMSDPDNSARSARTLKYGDTEVWIAVEPEAPGVVSLITTRSKREKTANGVRVGISENALRKKVKGLHCSAYNSGRQCLKGSGEPGTVFTAFLLERKKKVTKILIGRLAPE
jgi:hypothetical protein